MGMLMKLARSVAGALKPRGEQPSAAIREKLELAAQADARGDHANAERLCREALAEAPGSADAWMSLALALQPQGRPDEALAAFERTIALAPASAAAHYNLGRLHHSRRRFDRAIPALSRAIEL